MNLSTYLILALGIFHININTHALALSNVPDINAKTPIEQTIRIDHKCQYPFNPSSIVTILIFQQKGVSYISKGEKRCAWHFAKEVENTIRDSFFLPNYFKKKLLIDILKAKKRGKPV
jgi:hypothetical protein